MSAPFFSIIAPRQHELNWSRDHLIFYVLKGSVVLRVNAAEYTLTAEDFIAVEPGTLYLFSHDHDARLMQLTMPSALLRQLTRAPRGRAIRCFSGDHARDLSGTMADVRRRLANLFDLQYSSPEPNELLFTGRAILLYDFLYTHFSERTENDDEAIGERNVYDYLCAAFAYVRMHACDGVQLTETAAHIGVTPEYLSRSLRKYMDMSYTDLLIRERMRAAMEMLRDTDCSVTEIAYATGYSAPSAFTSAFKNSFGVTPRHYRTHLTDERPDESPRVQDMEVFDAIRKYIRHDAEEDITSGGLPSQQRSLRLDADAEGPRFHDGWKRVMAICTANDILKSTIQSQIRSAKRDLGFEYLYFHDVFNDDMMIYDEDTAGRPVYNFRNLDALLRFLLSVGLKPYMELSFLPLKLTIRDSGTIRFLNKMNVTPPRDWDRYEALVRATVEFCVRQYGMEAVRTWRFTSTMLYNVTLHGLLSYEDYLEMYRRTRRAVKSACPGAMFLGPGADVTLMAADWDGTFQPFIDYCVENDCLPDGISLRLYPIDMQRFKASDVYALRENRDIVKPCPNYFVDEGCAHGALVKVVEKLTAIGYPPERISIDRWNGSVSQTDITNDICYKSAYIVKTVLENRDLAANITYWTLSDAMAHLDFSLVESDLAGSLGLVTCDGLHKSAYYGMQLLSRLRGSVIAEGDGYIALKDESSFLLMLYQYCHYDRKAIETMLSKQVVVDPYTMCLSGERQVYSIQLENLRAKNWSVEFFAVGRRSGGNLYENWRRLGFPKTIKAWQRTYLDSISLPACRVGELQADEGVLRLNGVVEPHDVILIRLTPSDDQCAPV